MIAGRLKYRLKFYHPSPTTNEYGEAGIDYNEDSKVVRAERVKITGQRRQELGELFPDYSVQFNVRYFHRYLTEGWRVKELESGNLYTITNIIPNRDRGYLTLICERVNE